MAEIHSAGRADAIVLHSTLTCPHCGHREMLEMPTDSCRVFETCPGCGATLRPKSGDCCVFCSWGDVPCPPVQQARAAGTAASCC
jgi:hypothetical protein